MIIILERKTWILWGLLFCFIYKPVKAQNTEEYSDVWFLLLNHYKINEKWTLGNELHWRTTNFLDTKEQLLIRPYVNFSLNESVVFTAGYTFINSYPYRTNAIPKARPEHNIWQQVTLKQKTGKFSISHRYRIEERFSGKFKMVGDDYEVDGFSYSNRFRYRITAKYTLNEKYFINVFDEIWVRTNKSFGNATYDRNWLYIGFGRKLFSTASAQIAYLHQNINLGNDNFERHPTLQLTLRYDFE